MKVNGGLTHSNVATLTTEVRQDPDGEEDEDFDGRTNLEEYARGSDPFASDAGSNVGVFACAADGRVAALWAAVIAFLLIPAILRRRGSSIV